MEPTRHDMIYNVFQAHIEFGVYPKGACLPAISRLTEAYHVTVNTARKAYLHLQKDGYISVFQGRRTTVACDLPAEQCRRSAQEYYLARKDAKGPLAEALHVFLIPLLREGARSLQAAQLREIREIASNMETGSFYVTYFCGREMLTALQNRLALDLFQATVSYYQFPHILLLGDGETVRQFRELSLEIMSACDAEDREALFRAYLRLLDVVYDKFDAYLEKAEAEHPVPVQVPFAWDLYRERPQRCYTVAAKLLERIYMDNEFAPGDFLPSYGALAKDYGVSFSTIRRVAGLLEGLGALSVSQGQRPRAAGPDSAAIDPQDGAAQRICDILFQAAQMLTVTLESLTERCFPSLEREECLGPLLAARREGHSFKVMISCLDRLLRGRGNPALSAVWERLYEIMLLAQPVLGAQASCPAVRDRADACADALIQALAAGDQAAVHTALKTGICIMASMVVPFLPRGD